MKVRIYHNPRCSKSRQTLELLHEQNIQAEVVEYLQTPPDATTLSSLLDQLKLGPRDLMRIHEPAYKENNLDDMNLSDQELIQAMINNPILIERPIVVSEKGVAIGRPPENIKKIL